MLLVLLNHLIAGPLETATLPIDAAVRTIAYAGWTGLDIFFVLSGFLITGILLDTQGQPRWWPNFFVRRALRVFPVYYGALAILFVLLPRLVRGHDPDFITLQANQRWYWTYTVNLLAAFTHGSGAPSNTAHFWSLSIEEQFYLIWPLIVWACKPRTLLRVAVVTVVGGLALRLGLVLHGPSDPFVLYMLTPCRLDGLMTGAALAVVARAPGGLTRLEAWAPQVFRAGSLALIATAIWRGGLDVGDPVVAVAGYPIVALVCGALLVMAVRGPSTRRYGRALRSNWLRKWGNYSYGIYIVHWPLLAWIEGKTNYFHEHGVALLGGSRLPAVLLLAAVGTSMSYTLGWLSYHLYEKRFLELKRYFGRQPAARVTASLGAKPGHDARAVAAAPLTYLADRPR